MYVKNVDKTLNEREVDANETRSLKRNETPISGFRIRKGVSDQLNRDGWRTWSRVRYRR